MKKNFGITKERVMIALCLFFILLLYVARSISALLLFFLSALSLYLFFYVDKTYKLKFPRRYYLYVFVLIGLGPLIGSGEPPFGFYYRSVFYDKFLHFLLPLLMCIIIFYIVDRLNINIKWKLLMTVLMVFGILGLFEIGEYLLDTYFNTIYQGVYTKILKSRTLIQAPLDDTMQDLIFGVLGSLVFVIYKFRQRLKD